MHHSIPSEEHYTKLLIIFLIFDHFIINMPSLRIYYIGNNSNITQLLLEWTNYPNAKLAANRYFGEHQEII